MAIEYLKKAPKTAETNLSDTREVVKGLLSEIEAGGEEKVRELASRFDQWEGDIVVTPQQIEAAEAKVSEQVKSDIRFAHDNIRRFAEAQKSTISDCELEVVPGFFAGQKQIPLASAGCYVPGGRYSHIASALMTITTAKVAGFSILRRFHHLAQELEFRPWFCLR